MKKVTAVDFLLNEFQKVHKDFGGIDLEWLKRFDKAKEIEKQQIIDAKNCWFEDERDGEEYYNETFKK